jgi:hypothetical protein
MNLSSHPHSAVLLLSSLALAASTGACCAATASAAGAAAGAADTSRQVVVDAASKLAAISADAIGVNLAIWYNVTASRLPAAVAAIGPHILRWPGGSTADTYHWKEHTTCEANGHSNPAYEHNSTFDNFMTGLVTPGKYDAAVTVNYGSNVACSGGGDPAEAAAWVAYARSKGYNSRLHHWTVGNEVYGDWELDLHPTAHDPATYAAAMSGAGGFYQQMKSADAAALVGVAVHGSSGYHNWDSIVLAKAPYDFVEMHWYPQQPGSENDSFLLNQGPAALSGAIATLRAELTAAGRAGTPVMLGEVSSVAYSPGKQTTSIVNGLFTGMALGEILNSHLAVATWWFGAGGTQNCGHNNSDSLYGWQKFGAYDLVAVNTQYSWNNCNAGPNVPEGSVFPSGQVMALVSQFATAGISMLGVKVGPGLPEVRAYAADHADGYALMLFNLNASTSTTVNVVIANAAAGAYQASTTTYGRLQYDDSKNNVWTGPVSAILGGISDGATSVTLPPYSMTVLRLRAAKDRG